MRKFFSIVALFIVSSNIQAQLIVENSGKTAVGMSYNALNPLLSEFSVNTRGDENSLVSFASTNHNNGLVITRTGGLPYTTHSALRAENLDVWGLTQNYGIITFIYNDISIIKKIIFNR